MENLTCIKITNQYTKYPCEVGNQHPPLKMGKEAKRYNDHAKTRESEWRGAQDPQSLGSMIIPLAPFRHHTACGTATIQDTSVIINYKDKKK